MKEQFANATPVIEAVLRACNRKPLAAEAPVVLENAQFDAVSPVSAPLVLSIDTLLCEEPETVVLLQLLDPNRLLNSMPSSELVAPLFVMVQLIRFRPVTFEPLMPLPVLFVRVKSNKTTFAALVSDTASPVVLWIVPPDPAMPVPATIRPPEAPVLLRMIPLDGPEAPVPAKMLLNVRYEGPIVVLATFQGFAPSWSAACSSFP